MKPLMFFQSYNLQINIFIGVAVLRKVMDKTKNSCCVT